MASKKPSPDDKNLGDAASAGADDVQPGPDITPAPGSTAATAKIVQGLSPDEVLDRLDTLVDSTPELDNRDAVKDWLVSFREPLVSMGTNAIVGMIRARVGGQDKGELKALYAQLSPADLNAVMWANAKTVSALADEKAREAAIRTRLTDHLTQAAANLLLKAAIGAAL